MGLQEAYSRLTEAWFKAEELLANCRSYLEVWIELPKNSTYKKIGWAKYSSSGWRILVEIDEETIKPVQDCPTTCRMEMIKHFKELLEAVEDSAKEQVTMLAEVTAGFEETLTKLEEERF